LFSGLLLVYFSGWPGITSCLNLSSWFSICYCYWSCYYFGSYCWYSRVD